MIAKMQWTFIKSSITEKQILDLETKLGLSFPNTYKEVLLNYHGGRPNKRGFHTKKTKDKSIKTFLPITEDYKVNLLSVKSWLQLPPTMVPFANTPSGDYLCFDYYKDHKDPAIILWTHEARRKELITLQFHQFLEMLFETL